MCFSFNSTNINIIISRTKHRSNTRLKGSCKFYCAVIFVCVFFFRECFQQRRRRRSRMYRLNPYNTRVSNRPYTATESQTNFSGQRSRWTKGLPQETSADIIAAPSPIHAFTAHHRRIWCTWRGALVLLWRLLWGLADATKRRQRNTTLRD